MTPTTKRLVTLTALSALIAAVGPSGAQATLIAALLSFPWVR